MAGPAVIFNGQYGKVLKDKLKFKTTTTEIDTTGNTLSINAPLMLSGATKSAQNQIDEKNLDVYHAENYEETLTTAWSAGNNATILGGGVLVGTLATEVTTPIRGLTSFKYTNATGAVNDYFCSAAITLDPKQKDNYSGYTFYYSYDGADDDIKVVVWDVTNTKDLTSDLDLVKNKGSPTRYATSFYPPSTATDIRYCFQVLVANNTKILTWDDSELTSDPFVYKELVVTQEHNYNAAASSMTASTGDLRWGSLTPTGSLILEYSDSTGEFTAKTDCVVSMSLSAYVSAGNISLNIYKGTTLRQITISTGTLEENVADTFLLESGETVKFNTSTTVSGNIHMTVTAQAAAEHVVTPAKSGSESAHFDSFAAMSTNNTKVPYLTNERVNTFSELGTITNTSADGFYLTANVKIEVHATSTFYHAAGYAGWTLNPTATDLDTIVYNITADKLIGGAAKSVSSAGVEATAHLIMEAGDVLYYHTDGNHTFADDGTGISITAHNAEANFLAAVPIQKVAYIDVHATDWRSAAIAATVSYKTMPLVSVSGDTGFLSISSNQATLSDGVYTIEIPVAGFNGTSDVAVEVYSATDVAQIDEALKVWYSTANTIIGFTTVSFTFTITKSTAIELRTKSVIAAGSEYAGRIKITKLR